mgnify:FL=1|jgi:hypothetical protein
MVELTKEDLLLVYSLLEEAADDHEKYDDQREKYRAVMEKIENQLI